MRSRRGAISFFLFLVGVMEIGAGWSLWKQRFALGDCVLREAANDVPRPVSSVLSSLPTPVSAINAALPSAVASPVVPVAVPVEAATIPEAAPQPYVGRRNGVMTPWTVQPLELTDCGPDFSLPPPHARHNLTRDLVILEDRMRSKCEAMAAFIDDESYTKYYPPSAIIDAAPRFFAKLPGPRGFKPRYASPCWDDPVNTTQLRCLPAWVLIGQIKSGTTEMHERLMQHPASCRDITYRKELTWWSALGSDGHHDLSMRVDPYTAQLGDSLKAYPQLSKIKRASQPGGYDAKHPPPDVPLELRVLADGSPQYFSDSAPFYRTCPPPPPGTKLPYPAGPGCSKYVLAHQMMHAAHPKTRILLFVREPGDRLFSNYYFQHRYAWLDGLKGQNPSPEDFHQLAETLIDRFLDCYHRVGIMAWADRGCGEAVANCGCKPFRALGPPLSHRGADLMRSLYSEYLGPWLRIFGKEAVQVRRVEDYDVNRSGYMESMVKHVGLPWPMPAYAWENMLEKEDERYHAGPPDDLLVKKYNVTLWVKKPMLPKTRALLDAFFAPFNRKLARMLGDDRFLYRTPKEPPGALTPIEEAAKAMYIARRDAVFLKEGRPVDLPVPGRGLPLEPKKQATGTIVPDRMQAATEPEQIYKPNA